MGSVLLARQVVFNDKGKVWGYELLFRHPFAQRGQQQVEGRLATTSVIADGLELALPLLQPNERVLINMPGELLLDGTVRLLPRQRCVVEILETTFASPALLECLKSLRRQGFKLALDDYSGQPNLLPFLPLVDLVKIDALALQPHAIAPLLAGLRQHYPQLELLGEKIEDAPTYHRFRQHGCGLFQGFFFRSPELLQGRSIGSAFLTRLRLISLLCHDNYCTREVSDLIRSDACLSYKLFRYINCVSHGLVTKIDSVEQGVTILGRKNILQWLTATLTSAFAKNGFLSHLTYTSAINAFFLSSLCPENPIPKWVKEGHLHLLGLFMHLEKLVESSFAQLLQNISLQDEISQALLERSGPLAPWLLLPEVLTQGDWERLEQLTQQLGLRQQQREQLGGIYAESCRRVRELLLTEEVIDEKC